MSTRHLAVGCLVGVTALNLVLALRSNGRAAPPPVADRKEAPVPSEHADGFVELRFRLPRPAAAPAPVPVGFAKQGALVRTDNPLDLAIEGLGFFQVTTPNGELRYTRRGRLALNSIGNLTTADGFLVSPQITVPVDAVSVSVGADGTVSIQNPGALNASTILGQLTLVRFVNPAGLEKTHERLLQETAASGCPYIATPGTNGLGLLRQGFQEQHRDEMVRNVLVLLQQIAEEEDLQRITVRQEP